MDNPQSQPGRNGGVPFFCLHLGPNGRVAHADAGATALWGALAGAACPAPRPPTGGVLDWTWAGRVWRLWAVAEADGGLVLRGLGVTDLAETAALAEVRKGQLEAILSGAHEGMVIAAAGRIVFANPFMERLTGYDAATLRSRPFADFLHPDDREAVLSIHLRRLAGQDAPQNYAFRIVAASGAVRSINASSGRIEWDGAPAAVSFLADVSAQKAAEAALADLVRDQEAVIASRTANLREANARLTAEIAERRQANERLTAEIAGHERTAQKLKAARLKVAKALRAKSVFLANVSHEIRTPLNVVLGMADMALRPDSRGQVDQVRTLEMIRDAGSSLRNILGDLLDLSRAEAGRLELEQAPFSPRRVLAGVLAANQMPASRNGIVVSGEAAPDVPEWLLGDAGRLGQVLGNLVGNALKFTPAGSVAVAATLVKTGRNAPAGSVTVRFVVRDTGIGIPADKQKTIFESFSQADDTISRRFGGTGLGLAICRRLVGLMGGRMRLQSIPDQGSEFSFTARFAPTDGPPETPPQPWPSPELPPLDILLAEDSDLSAEMIHAFLTPKGHHVVRATNGEEALRILAHRRFDLVLMDIQMPVMDGIAAARAIRAGAVPGADGSIPIVALTAFGAAHDRERILQSGVTEYLSKPVNLDRLLDVMARSLGLGSEPGPDPAPGPVPAGADDTAIDAGRDAALANLGGDLELYNVLVGIFLRDTPADRRALEAAQAAGDVSRVALCAHSIKGNAAIVGATPAAERARELEQAARAGHGEALGPLVRTLAAVVERTLAGFAAKGHLPAQA